MQGSLAARPDYGLVTCRLEDRRQQLAPKVAVWQEYDADAQALRQDRLQAVRQDVHACSNLASHCMRYLNHKAYSCM